MNSRKISVIGLGYVGLPVAVAFGKSARVVGFDVNAQRIRELQSGEDRTLEVEPNDLRGAEILFTDQLDDLREADFHIVAVPTPINQAKQPELAPLLRASETVGKVLKRGDIVVYESTVYPGCTEDDCIPILERESGLCFGEDFGVGYSPERINPGDKEHTFTKIKKVVSGSSPEVCEIIAETYSSVVTAGVHRAPSIKVAEAAKVIENAQRDLNIAFVNELALIFDRLGIDTRDVLESAGTKWNFLPFQPGLGWRTLHRGGSVLPDASCRNCRLSPASDPFGTANQRRDGNVYCPTNREGVGKGRQRRSRCESIGAWTDLQGRLS